MGIKYEHQVKCQMAAELLMAQELETGKQLTKEIRC